MNRRGNMLSVKRIAHKILDILGVDMEQKMYKPEVEAMSKYIEKEMRRAGGVEWAKRRKAGVIFKFARE